MRVYLIAATALAVAACSTGPSGTEVTRFHLGQPIARSTISLVFANGVSSLENQTYADAIGEELRKQSFVPVVGDPNTAYVGTIAITRGARPGRSRGGFSIGLGGGSFGRGGGVGGGVTLPVGQSRPGEILATTLNLQIKRRSDASIVWEGRATAEADDRASGAQLPNAVPQLARALLSGFPGEPGKTVRIPAGR